MGSPLPPALIAAGVAGAAQIGSSIIGAVGSANQRQQAQDAINAAMAQINAIGAPPDQSAEIIREKLKQVGVYTPAMEQGINQTVSQVAQIQENPQMRNAQTSALEALQRRGAGGLNPEDRAAYNKLRNESAQAAEQKRQSIMQNLAARGMAGSGAELAAQLSAAQSGDQNLSEQGDRLAAQASQNALQAMMQAGQLGGQIRGQDFGVANTKAQAQDELNRFNTQNQLAIQQRNVAEQNRAQAANLAQQQGIANYNTEQGNAELLRQAAAKQQNWDNQLRAAQTKANVQQGLATAQQNFAGQNAQAANAIGSGAAGAINAFGQLIAKQPKKPLEETPGEVSIGQGAVNGIYGGNQ